MRRLFLFATLLFGMNNSFIYILASSAFMFRAETFSCRVMICILCEKPFDNGDHKMLAVDVCDDSFLVFSHCLCFSVCLWFCGSKSVTKLYTLDILVSRRDQSHFLHLIILSLSNFQKICMEKSGHLFSCLFQVLTLVESESNALMYVF